MSNINIIDGIKVFLILQLIRQIKQNNRQQQINLINYL